MLNGSNLKIHHLPMSQRAKVFLFKRHPPPRGRLELGFDLHDGKTEISVGKVCRVPQHRTLGWTARECGSDAALLPAPRILVEAVGNRRLLEELLFAVTWVNLRLHGRRCFFAPSPMSRGSAAAAREASDIERWIGHHFWPDDNDVNLREICDEFLDDSNLKRFPL
jgi:hypothetical protein